MPAPIENLSSALFDFLKNRVTLSQGVDEEGQATDTPEDMKVFSFDFVNKAGKDCGCVVISLLDDSESSNSLKVYFGQELTDASPDSQTEWYSFLKELRQVAKIHLLGFDVRNINKSRITKRDVEPMFESTFGPIDGSVKTSRQPLENMQIIIKHSQKVDPDKRNSRSRQIDRIYLANKNGEKFLLPFKSLPAARAMARHIEAGGTPYDLVGKNICNLVDEMIALRNFVKSKNNHEYEDQEIRNAIEASQNRFIDIKKQLNSMTSKGGYEKNKDLLSNNELTDPEELQGEDFLSNRDWVTEEDDLAIPYVRRAYNLRNNGMPEADEFDNWVNSSHPEKEGKEVLIDEKEPNFNDADYDDIENNDEFEDSYNENYTSCEEYGHEFKEDKDNPGYYYCIDCGESYNDNSEIVTEAKKGLSVKCPTCDANIGSPCKTRRIVTTSDKRVKTIHPSRKIAAEKLTEADSPSSAGWGSPLSFPYVKVPQHFNTPEEIKKMSNTSGELSPLSLLSSQERDTNENGEELDQIVYLSGGKPFKPEKK